MGNKVKFNICNVHYAPLTAGEDGADAFGTPVAMPGAVSLSLDPNGEPESFYADGVEYYAINNNANSPKDGSDSVSGPARFSHLLRKPF